MRRIVGSWPLFVLLFLAACATAQRTDPYSWRFGDPQDISTPEVTDLARTIAGVAFLDKDWNGVRGPDDEPMVGAEVSLWFPRHAVACPSRPTQNRDWVVAATQTDDDGAFAFRDVPEGKYCVAVTDSADTDLSTPTSHAAGDTLSGWMAAYEVTAGHGWNLSLGYHWYFAAQE